MSSGRSLGVGARDGAGSGRLCYCSSCCDRRRLVPAAGGASAAPRLAAGGEAAEAALAAAAAPIDMHAPYGASRRR